MTRFPAEARRAEQALTARVRIAERYAWQHAHVRGRFREARYSELFAEAFTFLRDLAEALNPRIVIGHD